MKLLILLPLLVSVFGEGDNTTSSTTVIANVNNTIEKADDSNKNELNKTENGRRDDSDEVVLNAILEDMSDDIPIINPAKESNSNLEFRKKNVGNFVTFTLYTRKRTRPNKLIHMNCQSIKDSMFDGRKQVVFIIHGRNDSSWGTMCSMVGQAYLKSVDANVILVDWLNHGNSYNSSAAKVTRAGKEIGKFIKWLRKCCDLEYPLRLHKLHIITHGYGGQVAAEAAREVNDTIRRITALDPGGDFSELNENGELKLLNEKDAHYVELILTSFMTTGAKGHGEFYPNGGARQPGCRRSEKCNHDRAYKLMAASILHNRMDSLRCKRHDEISKTKPCTGRKVPMGNTDLNKMVYGQYKLQTIGHYPFVMVDTVKATSVKVIEYHVK